MEAGAAAPQREDLTMRRVMLAIALWLAPFDVFAQVPGGTFAQSSSAEATHIFKATPGALYSIYATNLTATAGFLVVVSAAPVPADGLISARTMPPSTRSG